MKLFKQAPANKWLVVAHVNPHDGVTEWYVQDPRGDEFYEPCASAAEAAAFANHCAKHNSYAQPR